MLHFENMDDSVTYWNDKLLLFVKKFNIRNVRQISQSSVTICATNERISALIMIFKTILR